jgi:serine/threonine protein kinase
MINKRRAFLKDGRTVEYILTEDPPSGGMKKTYFSPDKSYVVQFYHDEEVKYDTQRISRLEAITGKYNPTFSETLGGARGTTQKSSDYFRKLFCWPTGIVTKPELGLVSPAYPKNYYFSSGPFEGKEKEARWFTSERLKNYLPDNEKGEWINYLKISILLARAVRKLHQSGLSHSDLSSKNVLIDPSSGECIVIDIDSLVVPKLYPPDVMGTPGYIAPEVLITQDLPSDNPDKKMPSIKTDQHALAVLIYEYLLSRHPLIGPKVNSEESAEEDDFLSMGEKALFIEHPEDTSNRPEDLNIPYNSLGKYLSDLFYRAFVTGLHSPSDRPGAMEWERGLVKTLDLLLPCPGQSCSQKWFILNDFSKAICPFCGTDYNNAIPVLKLRTERRPGQWMEDSKLVIYNNISLFKWHVFDNIFPGEEADWTPQAYFTLNNGQWSMINKNLNSLAYIDGKRIPPGKDIVLNKGNIIRLSQEPHGRIAEVQFK